MSERNVRWILRADGIFNLIAALILQFYVEALLPLLGWMPTDTTVYSMTLGSALVGLSLVVLLASNHPVQARDGIFASIVAKGLAGISIVYALFVTQIDSPAPSILLLAVGLQVIFAAGEAAFLLGTRRRSPATLEESLAS